MKRGVNFGLYIMLEKWNCMYGGRLLLLEIKVVFFICDLFMVF